jgi:hypothetical protein
MKKYILVLFFGIFYFGPIIWMFIIVHRNQIKPSSNNRIINYYEGVLCGSDSLFLNQVAKAYIGTKYEGTLEYNCFSPGSRTHTLYDYDSGFDLTDSFPKIREIIKKEYPNARDCWYGFGYNSGVVFIYLAHSSLYNQNETFIWLIYSPNPNNLKPWFSEYKIYPKDSIPIEPYNWLYKFDKNWYICSPEGHLRYYSKDLNNENY